MWIDTFVEFESGRHCTAIKNVTTAEEHVHDMFPGYPVLPPGLMIEGMAQAAGILVGEARDFAENVILAKISKAEFSDYGFPGDQLRYHAKIENLDEQGAVTSGVVQKNGSEIGRIDLIFSHVNRTAGKLDLPEHNFVFTECFSRLVADVRCRTGKREPSSR